MNKECDNCIKRKTMWCPPSCECMALDELPYYLDKTLALQKIDNLQQKNKQLKKRNKELEDGFKATTDELCEYATKIDKTINLTKNLLKTENKGYYQIIFKEILKSLGDKENE